MNGGSGEKRVGRLYRNVRMILYAGVIGTLPIFARKRPRVALMAFSSSQNPATAPVRGNTSLVNAQEYVQEKNYFTSNEKENYQQHYGGNKPVTNWRYNFGGMAERVSSKGCIIGPTSQQPVGTRAGHLLQLYHKKVLHIGTCHITRLMIQQAPLIYHQQPTYNPLRYN